MTEFGKLRMQREVRKLQEFATNCQKSRSCFKSKFTTIRDSPNASDLLRLSKLKGNKIGTRLDKDYGMFKVRDDLVTNYILIVAKQMVENGGGCSRGLFTSISHDRQPWPICSHSNHLSWWSKDEPNEQNNIIQLPEI